MKKILIVFTDIHLSYSPTTLNLYDSLAKYFEVTIIAFKPNENYSSHKLLDKRVEYLSITNWESEKGIPLVQRLINEVKKTLYGSTKVYDPLVTEKAKLFIERISSFNGIIIAIDFFALWCVQKAGKIAHFISLEIRDEDIYRNNCFIDNIQSVIIQTNERYEYLFGKRELNTFLIQNAPKYIEQPINYSSRKAKDLIFCGSAMPGFGIFSCIEFLIDYPDYTLTIKGAIPPNIRNSIEEKFGYLLMQKRLILNDEYLSPEDLNNFLANFYIGFAFYDDYRFYDINNFNYKTAPSGKLFQYYNAGIPVIASNNYGLNSIKKFGAGVMIDTLNASNIKKAIMEIEDNYLEICKASKNASKYFDFSESIKPFITYLQEH